MLLRKLVLLSLFVFTQACSVFGDSEDGAPSAEETSPEDGETDPGDSEKEEDEVTPIYVTIVSHNERSDTSLRTCTGYKKARASLLKIADIIKAHNATWNWQTDYLFLDAVSRCETAALKATTNGKNIVQYLVEDLGVEANPHAHESDTYNFADVAYLLSTFTGTTSLVVGGFEYQDEEKFENFKNGQTGNAYPTFEWNPEVLTLSAVPGHDLETDDHTSGIWNPKGAGDDFHTQDSASVFTAIGSGYASSGIWTKEDCYFEYATDFIEVLARDIKSGNAPAGKMYTASIFISENDILTQNSYDVLETMLTNLDDYVTSGQVIYSTYSNVITTWETTYSSTPNIYEFDVEEEDYTCE